MSLRVPGRKRGAVFLVILILGIVGCRKGRNRTPAIGEAYAGPATLSLRKDIPLQSPVVATVRHGDRLEIIQRRRRFFRVRTPSGAEGWIEDHQLLSSDEIAALKEIERRARILPSQGLASTYDLLNVHTAPNRLSPSFLQIGAGEKVAVVGHVVTPRKPPERKPLIPARPKKLSPPRKHPESRYALPPPPSAPPAPANWLELSRTPPQILQERADEKAQHPEPTDDWSLVRNARGQSGWVLTRRLYMAIPDDVAQYAEGHRITSYFPLGDLQDGDQVKHNWLWTTISGGEHPYDFDSFRVFIWSLRRHRYETAFIQRNVEGYFPVLTKPVDLSTAAGARGTPSSTTYPGFSVCVLKDGSRVRRNYAFIVNVVRFAGEQPCEPPVAFSPDEGVPTQAVPPQPARPQPPSSLYARVKSGLSALARKVFRR